jgi:hypothetical protein
MTVRQKVDELLSGMSEEQQRLVLELARFLSLQSEHDGWRRAAREQFAKAYGADEPEYTEADLKPESHP